MFKKIGRLLSNSFEKAFDLTQEHVLKSLTAKYPDIDEVLEVFERLKSNQSAIEGPSETEDEGDGKWRPMLLTVALLFKLQKIHESFHDNWYNKPNIFLDEGEDDYLNVFGFYWHLIIKVAEVLRADENQSQLNEALDEKIKDLNISTVFANVTDNSHVDEHCPDFALLVDHPHKLIVINICGTRMIPAPKMSDVFMDLCATAEPFLNGKAHRGMAIGARNILTKIQDQLQEAINQNPTYGILVTGYSLGAGICQLVAMELLQKQPNVRCISYGAPLIFAPDNPELSLEQNSEIGKRLYTVVCSHDGLASASLLTVSKLLAQVRAIDGLCMRRRDMIKLLMTSVPTEEGIEMKEEDDSDEDDDYDKEKLSHKPQAVLTDQWKEIENAISNVELNNDIAKLTHPALNIFVFKRKNDQVVTRYFQDGGLPFADNLRLRGAMFSHHMPWSYKSLFENYGMDLESTSAEKVNSILDL